MRAVLLAAVLLGPLAGAAQESASVRAARAHFQASEAGARLGADLADLHPDAVHTDARTGLTFVTLVQRHAGLEVFGARATAAVAPDGTVRAAPARFERGLARRAGPPDPALGPEAARTLAEAAARRALDAPRPAAGGVPTLTDDPAVDGRRPAAPVLETTAPRLGYHPMPDGSLRLAWAVVVTSASGPALARAVRLDAQTGAVLADLDLAVHDVWPGPRRLGAAGPSPEADSVPEATPIPEAGPPLRAGTYRVVGESPSHGAFVLVSDPADPVASPRGWHDDGAAVYTTTRGNNVYAYLDADGNDAPDPDGSPDGGGALAFDFRFDPEASPVANAPAALTNLFYWSNRAHDVAYRYGFDEGAGNFQTTNFTAASGGGDALRAEALDGSGLNNANFTTPPEGRPPRMQMFLWEGGTAFSVTAPAGLAGPYPSAAAAFGPQVGFEGGLHAVAGPEGQTTACSTSEVGEPLTGRIALVERGGCLFVDKVRVAEALGAAAVVVYNCPADDPACGSDGNRGEALVQMNGTAPDVGIPSAFVQRSTGLALRDAPGPAEVAFARLADRDAGLDAGVVVHEYAHGLSNRLIGGPEAVDCLANGFTHSSDPALHRPGEQMGEGWSDAFGLLLTQRPGDTGARPRGVGTYLLFEPPDGPGVRNAPYSTDFAVNDYTYQDVIDHAGHAPTGPRGLSVPHGVGFVWATALWEMTWALIDAHGYSDDLADAGGRAGNQVALNLFTTGLKLTPCRPGFVDARDAILAADEALYGGAHVELLWGAFARRGLGVQASQGSPASHTDGRASFLTPGDLGAVSLSAPAAEATVAPGATATVAVRLVSERAADTPFQVDAEAAPPWVEVSPASGTLPAGGEAELAVTFRPGPFEVGTLRGQVPVLIANDTRLVLAVRAETDAPVGGTHELSPLGPNPARERARFTLAVPTAQTVAVDVFDRLGRRVRTEAVALESGVRRAVDLDLGGLAAGFYVVRVSGAGFAEAKALTVAGR